MLEDEVRDFIRRRWRYNHDWLNGNCYWFASILATRFPELKIYYQPIEGHFYAGKDGVYFDWKGGHIIPYEEVMELSEIFKLDRLWYNRLVRDCIM